MTEHRQDVLRLQPHMIPTVRAAFGAAIDQLDDALGGLRRGGVLSEPWLGDETSGDTAAHYTVTAMDGADSSFNYLQQYRAELNRVHDTLQQMEDEYRRREGDDAARWGRLA